MCANVFLSAYAAIVYVLVLMCVVEPVCPAYPRGSDVELEDRELSSPAWTSGKFEIVGP